jgi:hypothetical protein
VPSREKLLKSRRGSGCRPVRTGIAGRERLSTVSPKIAAVTAPLSAAAPPPPPPPPVAAAAARRPPAAPAVFRSMVVLLGIAAAAVSLARATAAMKKITSGMQKDLGVNVGTSLAG